LVGLILAVVLTLTQGCTPVTKQAGTLPVREELANLAPFHEPLHAILRSIDEGRYKEAEKQVNQLLVRDPANARLHLLNGLLYYRQFTNGDRAMADQAEAGFTLARQFDPSLSLASYLLGSLNLDLRRFDKARIHLLDAATSRRFPEALLSLAHASYYARDIPLAVWAIDAYLQLLPGDRNGLKAGAVIYAASGDDSRARVSLVRLGEAGEGRELTRLAQRVEDWGNLFSAALQAPDAGVNVEDSVPARPASAVPPADAPAKAPEALHPGAPWARSWSDCAQSLQAGTGTAYGTVYGTGSYGSTGVDEMPAMPALPSPCEGLPLPRMAILDVVIVRAEEISGFNHGINLLDGISMVLGFNWSETHTSGTADDNVIRTVTRTAGLPAAGLAYSLNIFRVGGSRAEVLARPSLLVLDRLGSTFFSGSTVSVALTGQYSSSLQDKNIGVGMSVTPTFIDDETMLLAVKVTRSFVQPIQISGFGQSMTTSKNTVTANTRIKFGDTMILSGLRERETYMVESGVPVLSRIPVIKYLFGSHGEDEYTKHVLVFITPRKPERFEDLSRQVKQDQDELKRIGERGALPAYVSDRLRQITQQYGPNLRAVMANLGHYKYRQEFITGDLGDVGLKNPGFFQKILKDIE